VTTDEDVLTKTIDLLTQACALLDCGSSDALYTRIQPQAHAMFDALQRLRVVKYDIQQKDRV
jgi:hypothetical protein